MQSKSAPPRANGRMLRQHGAPRLRSNAHALTPRLRRDRRASRRPRCSSGAWEDQFFAPRTTSKPPLEGASEAVSVHALEGASEAVSVHALARASQRAPRNDAVAPSAQARVCTVRIRSVRETNVTSSETHRSLKAEANFHVISQV